MNEYRLFLSNFKVGIKRVKRKKESNICCFLNFNQTCADCVKGLNCENILYSMVSQILGM